MTLAEKIIDFNQSLRLNATLPVGFGVMNPFADENKLVIGRVSNQFYTKFYSDNNLRTLIIGINPGRLGAGLTGIPFTDTKRLNNECGIALNELTSHEPSSVFVYKVIEAMGGTEAFYANFLITSACPLGFLHQTDKGKWVNANYYDSPSLFEAVRPFMVRSLKQWIEMAQNDNRAFVLGTGLNFKYLSKLNSEEHLFEELIPLEHPRFVMQYKAKLMSRYVTDFVTKLTSI